MLIAKCEYEQCQYLLMVVLCCDVMVDLELPFQFPCCTQHSLQQTKTTKEEHLALYW